MRCARDLTVVVLFFRCERQDGQNLPVAEEKLPVQLGDFAFFTPTPSEVRPLRGTCVSDRTGGGVGLILSGHLCPRDCRFGWIGYKSQGKSISETRVFGMGENMKYINDVLNL